LPANNGRYYSQADGKRRNANNNRPGITNHGISAGRCAEIGQVTDGQKYYGRYGKQEISEYDHESGLFKLE
jgi:hypothetical protein